VEHAHGLNETKTLNRDAMHGTCIVSRGCDIGKGGQRRLAPISRRRESFRYRYIIAFRPILGIGRCFALI